MTLVLDASGALELLLGRKQSAFVLKLLQEADFVVCPDLYSAEITNVLWKYVRYEDYPVSKAEVLLEQGLAIPDNLVPVQEMAVEVFAVACQTRLTAYDAAYLVLARRQNADLLTLDKKLKKVARSLKISVIDDND